MRRVRYMIVDVFTERQFGGNPLAVFTNGRGLSAELMQTIARELNLSETTFVLPAAEASNHYRVRIFTPAVELPMAGHPTVGTSYVLARERLFDWSGEEATLRLEEGVGTILVRLSFRDGRPEFIEMSQPLPTFGDVFEDIDAVAHMLSLDAEEIADTNLPLQVVSCGVPFLFVPLRDLRAARRLRFRLDVWERTLKETAAPQVFVFTRETQFDGATVHSRMFAPAAGILEDPATGGASGPLGCYLVRHGVVPDTEVAEILSEQGIEMGRPSFIRIRIERRGEEITGVRVGGQCRYVGEGFFEIED